MMAVADVVCRLIGLLVVTGLLVMVLVYVCQWLHEAWLVVRDRRRTYDRIIELECKTDRYTDRSSEMWEQMLTVRQRLEALERWKKNKAKWPPGGWTDGGETKDK